MIPQDPVPAPVLSPVEEEEEAREEEEEEQRIEKFFELLERIKQMKQKSRSRGGSGRRGRSSDDPSWKPKFAVEDFNLTRGTEKRNSGCGDDGLMDEENRFLLGVGRKRKAEEEEIMRTGVVRSKEQLSTELNLTLGL